MDKHGAQSTPRPPCQSLGTRAFAIYGRLDDRAVRRTGNMLFNNSN